MAFFFFFFFVFMTVGLWSCVKYMAVYIVQCPHVLSESNMPLRC